MLSSPSDPGRSRQGLAWVRARAGNRVEEAPCRCQTRPPLLCVWICCVEEPLLLLEPGPGAGPQKKELSAGWSQPIVRAGVGGTQAGKGPLATPPGNPRTPPDLRPLGVLMGPGAPATGLFPWRCFPLADKELYRHIPPPSTLTPHPLLLTPWTAEFADKEMQAFLSSHLSRPEGPEARALSVPCCAWHGLTTQGLPYPGRWHSPSPSRARRGLAASGTGWPPGREPSFCQRWLGLVPLPL